jgi:hypothetical protein
VPSAVQSIQPLSALLQSNHCEAKKMQKRVIKTSAVLMQLSQGAPYEFHAKQRAVALNW